MRKRSVIRDTIQMTVIQFFLECLALWFNAWMTRRVGAATVGTLALAGSFFNLAAMVAGGNAMLCASRFVSEELGKPCGCPARVLRHGISFCMMLSLPVTAGVCIFAQPLSQQFLQSDSMAHAGAAHGTASAAGQSECLPERLFQCSVPRDSDSRLRCGGISAPCGNPHRTAPVAWGHQTGTGLHGSGVQHGVWHTVYGGHTDSAVLSEAGTLRRNVQPCPCGGISGWQFLWQWAAV